MKHLAIIASIWLLICCNSKKENFTEPDNALDAGREFIQLSLQGKFNAANMYMLQDDDNKYWLDKWSKEFAQKSEQEKTAFATASINISEVADVVPDSVTVIVFSNSFKKSSQKVKVVKQNGRWRVDFKYTFSGNL